MTKTYGKKRAENLKLLQVVYSAEVSPVCVIFYCHGSLPPSTHGFGMKAKGWTLLATLEWGHKLDIVQLL